MSNAKRFLETFNKIENYIKKLNTPYYSNFGFVKTVRNLSKSNIVIKKFEDDLIDFADLRNAITHRKDINKPLAEPYDEIVVQIQKIMRILTKPKLAYDIANKPVYCANTIDPIVEVISNMEKNVYTHIPVYENKIFIGLFSESSIVKWLGKNSYKDGFLLEESKIGELSKYYDKIDDPFSTYKIIRRDLDVFTIEKYFQEMVQNKIRLGAIIVTENGKNSEKPLGIITSWDLPKINDYLQL